MAQTKRTKGLAEKISWFRYRLNHPFKGQLMLQQQSRDPHLDQLEYASGSVYYYQELEMKRPRPGSDDHELVDLKSSEKWVSNEFKENRDDQETETEGDDEEGEDDDERFGDVKAPKNQYPSSLYYSLEMDNRYDNRGDNHGRTEMEMETGMDRLRVWLDRMGLGKYVILFELHDVNDEVSQFLTAEDLKEMGVTQVGSGWKIYCYIKKLCI